MSIDELIHSYHKEIWAAQVVLKGQLKEGSGNTKAKFFILKVKHFSNESANII